MLFCMRTTLNLDDELARTAKARAAEEGRTLTDLIEGALRGELARPRKAAPSAPLPADGAGGVLDGVEISSNRALRDRMDDLN